MTTPTLDITDSAVKKIMALREKKGNAALMLRVTVNGGGCSGFQYQLDLVETSEPEDITFEKGGITVITDATSMDFLDGATVDFEQDMIKSAFKIRNPNATANCGCGTSFSV